MIVYLLLIFCSVFLTTLLVLYFFRRRTNPAVQRLRSLGEPHPAQVKDQLLRKKAQAGKWVDQLVSRIGQVPPEGSRNQVRLQHTLALAGFDGTKYTRIFTAIKLLAAIVFMLVYGLLGWVSHRNPAQVALISFGMLGFGYLLPDVVLNFKARKRQQYIAGGLPDALDLLVISVEAGLGLNAAIMRVGQEIRLRSLPLSEELLMVNQDMRAGQSREKALRRLSERNNVESLRILVGALLLADRLGTSIADTLRIQADSLRTRVRQRAEEQAAKAGVKMLIPLVLFILPALFVVLLGPGFLTLTKAFSEISGR
jgi:tight adherence protein C